MEATRWKGTLTFAFGFAILRRDIAVCSRQVYLKVVLPFAFTLAFVFTLAFGLGLLQSVTFAFYFILPATSGSFFFLRLLTASGRQCSVWAALVLLLFLSIRSGRVRQGQAHSLRSSFDTVL